MTDRNGIPPVSRDELRARPPLIRRPDRSQIAADARDLAKLAIEPHVCPTCQRPDGKPGLKPMTGLEVANAIMDSPFPARLHRLVLDLTPHGGPTVLPPRTVWADIYGVQWGDGGVEGWWMALELGRVHYERIQNAPDTSKEKKP